MIHKLACQVCLISYYAMGIGDLFINRDALVLFLQYLFLGAGYLFIIFAF